MSVSERKERGGAREGWDREREEDDETRGPLCNAFGSVTRTLYPFRHAAGRGFYDLLGGFGGVRKGWTIDERFYVVLCTYTKNDA